MSHPRRTYSFTGQFRWNHCLLEQHVFVVRHFADDPEGVGTHYEWHLVKVDNEQVVQP